MESVGGEPLRHGSYSRRGRDESRGPLRVLGECPSADDILEFCGGQLPAERSKSFRRHIEVCAACMDLVTGVVNDWAPAEASDLLEVGSNFRAGDRVGGFRLTRFIARGGMGEVYEACDVESGAHVALKAILAAACDRRHLLRAFCREARLARRIRHPNVCHVHAPRRDPAAASSPVPFFTMDYIEGETLQARLRGGPLTVAETRALGEQVLLGLNAIHEAGVLHLDIKASNIMLRSGTTPRAVILDFGLACHLREQRHEHRPGPLTGSLPYMPPEQILGEPPSHLNDVFAFGVVLFQMLTAELPFPMAQPSTPSSIVERLAAHAHAPSTVAAGVPPWLDRLVLRCLAEPERRPRGASDLLAALAAG